MPRHATPCPDEEVRLLIQWDLCAELLMVVPDVARYFVCDPDRLLGATGQSNDGAFEVMTVLRKLIAIEVAISSSSGEENGRLARTVLRPQVHWHRAGLDDFAIPPKTSWLHGRRRGWLPFRVIA
jgi:hypothetical protein